MEAVKLSYAEAAVAEVRSWSERLNVSRLTSVYFGGGTPSEMPSASITAILDSISQAAGAIDDDVEVTIEANPGTTNSAAMAELRDAGVNRISLGAQSFSVGELLFLDRIHSPEAIAASVEVARDVGFSNVSLDLIYGLPGQTKTSWLENVDRALELEPDHLSMYALTVEDDTMLAKRVSDRTVVPASDDDVSELYELGSERLTRTALAQYEVSNWGRPGFESRHNRVYWTDGEYLGIGAGAHGYLDGARYENEPHPRKYIDRLTRLDGARDHAIVDRYRPDRVTAIADWLGLRLRLLEGFTLTEFRARFEQDLEDVIGAPIERAIRAGVLDRLGDVLRLSESGRLVHSELVVNVMAHLAAARTDGLSRAPDAG